MRKVLVRILAAIALAGTASPSQAAILNLMGSGTVCSYYVVGGKSFCQEIYNGPMTAQIGINVLADVPAGPGSFLLTNSAIDPFGWVASTFEFTWASGSFVFEPLQGETISNMPARVENDYFGLDRLAIAAVSQINASGPTAAVWQTRSAGLERFTKDTSWLNSLAFPASEGLAPGEWNTSTFTDYSFVFDYYTESFTRYTGFSANATWESATVTTSVPEPGTLALLGLGLAGLGVARRKRAA